MVFYQFESSDWVHWMFGYTSRSSVCHSLGSFQKVTSTGDKTQK